MKVNLKDKIDKIIDIIWKNRRWIVMLLFMIIFFEILSNIVDDDIYYFDMRGYELVTTRMTDGVTWGAKIITKMASPIVLVLLTFVLFGVLKDKKTKYSIFINLAVAASLNSIIKHVIQRPRPVGYRLIDEKGYSFPSGHSMVSMAFYGYLIYIINTNVKSKWIRIVSTILLSTLIVLIGTSRIYLGVHYTSDVCGGFCVAIAYLMVYTGILKRMSNKDQEDDD